MGSEAVTYIDRGQSHGQAIGSVIALTLLYYDYALTFDLELRLFWSQHSFKQWGSILFFLNRYFGVIGHVPFILQRVVRHNSALNRICKPFFPYRQILTFMMQTVIGSIFITRTYALYNRSRAVLAGLTSLGFTAIAVSAYMLHQGIKHAMGSSFSGGNMNCLNSALSESEPWRLAVIWGSVMVFDFIVVVLTLVRVIYIKRRSGKNNALTHVLIRDGVMYYGVTTLAMLSTVIPLLHGAEKMRGVPVTMTNILASVLASRLMLNLRESGEYSGTSVGVASSAPSSILSRVLTNIEDVDEDVVHESLDCQRDRPDPILETNMDSIAEWINTSGQAPMMFDTSSIVRDV
ncbi:hypothetical protein BJ322DRAFT_1039880 [Thelephora terrestris]|uniref:DUF6533 domain-containing protein n=1 Tax=Thelephora terrestris TaxID=56493 RepID=A0A9P6HN48_9AGAM|nr:hypothetical protein BJ322DRAFT_1039880 [Thelephora terrestris]